MHLDSRRLEISSRLDHSKRSALGQFLTPTSVADFMAGLFPEPTGAVRLLDAGAGIGSLTAAFAGRWGRQAEIDTTAFEIDPAMRAGLAETLALCGGTSRIVETDFIEEAVNALQFGMGAHYTHAILNPPYKKINSASRHRHLLRAAGIETVNLYSAFVALALALLVPGGQMVVIIPRSFCNGPYYRPFREFLLARARIRHIHLFDARDKAFRDDAVLQENVILRLERDGAPGTVKVSTSTDDGFADYVENVHPFSTIVFPGDPEVFIHIPTDAATASPEWPAACSSALTELGLEVSTGPVIDFRLKPELRDTPEPDCVPLLYPAHFSGVDIAWPKPDGRKPNALRLTNETRKWLFPAGCYVAVRRFSSKEEKRRVVAAMVPDTLAQHGLIGFENHLNVFHTARRGLPAELARGLAVYLNCRAVDRAFRLFSGHTQVNATDLRRLRYPSRDALSELGKWASAQSEISMDAIDYKIENMT
jgi:tRNA1(Val) A37 N6-methylase TrmN6